MKHLVILLLLVLLTSCVKQETIEKHEVMFLMVNIPNKEVFLYDITDNTYVSVNYSYTLFQMEWYRYVKLKGILLLSFIKVQIIIIDYEDRK